MKKFRNISSTILLSAALVSFQAAGTAPKSFNTIKNDAFNPGEKLTFKIHYGIINAGEATLQVLPDKINYGGRACYQVIGTGQSVGFFNFVFKVHDTYQSTIDSQSLEPWYFVRHVNEGGYIINQNVSFNHYRDSAVSQKKTIYMPDNTQDVVSALYYARNLDLSNAKEGQVFQIQGYMDDTLISLNIKFIGREVISTSKGDFQCLKFKPMLQQGRVFKDSESMTVWLSDDKNHIPVRVQSDIIVGSIKMDLVDYENLANKPALQKD